MPVITYKKKLTNFDSVPAPNGSGSIAQKKEISFTSHANQELEKIYSAKTYQSL